MSLTVAAIQPPAAIFREEQRFGWWTYIILALMMLGAWSVYLGRGHGFPHPIVLEHNRTVSAGIALGLTLPVLLVLGVLRMTTIVTPAEVRVWLGFLPSYRRSIPISTIDRVEVVQFHPWADHGGWGVLHGRDGERVVTARGDRGVRLHLRDGSRLLIGSQRPEQLALAVEGALRPGI